MARPEHGTEFPRINLMPDRQRVVIGRRPTVRAPLWVGLIVATAALIAVMAWLLLPHLLAPR